MNAYLDSSVVLRVVLRESGMLKEWSRITAPVTSEIARVESLRALDRLRLAGAMAERELSRRRGSMLELFRGVEMVRVNRAVLDRAGEPFPTQIRTLDAIHISSALLVRTRTPTLRFATHDADLAVAAHAVGLHVIGSQ